ncbi:MAG: hypothetical protein WEB67_09080 [Acidimicrobiia bacterium]
MIWLQGPQWIRWTMVVIIAIVALWTEFRGDGMVEHPFAIETIAPGDEINDDAVEMRLVPSGLLPRIDAYGVAARTFLPDEPITPGGIATEAAPAAPGWWYLEIAVPRTARVGDPVQLVLIDTGVAVAGTVRAVADDDPLGNGLGSVAIPPDQAVAVAAASANGRVVVLVSSG